jgi:hypothetical protein
MIKDGKATPCWVYEKSYRAIDCYLRTNSSRSSLHSQ